MKIQFNILKEKIKNNILWILIIVFLVLLNLILLSVKPIQIKSTKLDFLTLIGFPGITEYNGISLLILLYQLGWTLYINYIFYIHEFEHSLENILLRINQKKWIISKIIIIVPAIILCKIVFILLIYLYFCEDLSFSITYIIYPIFYTIFLTLELISIINFLKTNNIIKVIVGIVIAYILFINFNIWFIIAIILVLIYINIKYFNIKKITS